MIKIIAGNKKVGLRDKRFLQGQIYQILPPLGILKLCCGLIKELHARTLKPLLLKPSDKAKIIVEAKALSAAQQNAKDGGQGRPVEASAVVGRLKAALVSSAGKNPVPLKVYNRAGEVSGVTFSKKGRKMVLEFSEDLSRASLGEAMSEFMNEHFPKKLPTGES